MTTNSAQTRVSWIDATKGVMIILVVFGHAWRGLESKGIIPTELFSAVDSRIYAFHMPVFFALSGWFFIRSLSKTTLPMFWKDRVIRLLWPMVLWTYIFLGMKVLAGELANSPMTMDEFFVLPIPGVLHMWFLWALLLMSLAFSLLQPLCKDGKASSIALLATTAIVVTLQFIPLEPETARWIGQAIYSAPFLLLGIILGQNGMLQHTNRAFMIGSGITFLLILIIWPSLGDSEFVPVIKLVLTVCVLGVFSHLTFLSTGQIGKVLIFLGTASLPIYVAHTVFSAAMREALFVVGFDNLWGHLLLGTLIGLIGPVILLLIARKLRVERVLGF